MIKQSNINPELVEKLDQTPEDIFSYIYGVLHSNIYRTKYSNELRYGFPRVPFTTNQEVFKTISELGKKLIAYHLLKKFDGPHVITNPVDGNNIITQLGKRDEDGKIWYNDTQYIEGVPEHIWDMKIGQFQVIWKWIKTHKGYHIKPDEIQKIVNSLQKTLDIQDQIDLVYDKVEESLLNE